MLLAKLALLALAPIAQFTPGIQPFGAVPAKGALWVNLYGSGQVAKIDPATNKVLARVRVGPQPISLAYGASSLWVGNGGSTTVSRINPTTRKVVKTIKVGARPYGVT